MQVLERDGNEMGERVGGAGPMAPETVAGGRESIRIRIL